MTELTDEAVTALLAHYDLPTDCDCDGDDCVKCSHYPTFQERASKQLKDAAPDLARALLAARAELDRVKADAAVAVAMMVERAAENKEQLDIWAQEILEGLSFADVLKITSYDDKIEAHNIVGRGLVDVILNLAPADGLAAVDALRDRAEKAEQERDAAVRGRNDWRDDFKALAAAIVGDTGLSAMTVAAQARTFRPRAEKAEADRDTLAAELTRLRADAAAMDDAVAHYPHPGYGKPYPITTVLRDLASQEGCDGEPYDAMMFAAKTIDDMRAAGHGTSVWAGSARMASLLIRGGEGDA